MDVIGLMTLPPQLGNFPIAREDELEALGQRPVASTISPMEVLSLTEDGALPIVDQSLQRRSL